MLRTSLNLRRRGGSSYSYPSSSSSSSSCRCRCFSSSAGDTFRSRRIRRRSSRDWSGQLLQRERERERERDFRFRRRCSHVRREGGKFLGFNAACSDETERERREEVEKKKKNKMLESQSAGEISSRTNQNKNSRYYENTLAHMLGREEDQGFFKDHRGHLVQPVLTPTPEGSPFGVELELVEDVISSSHFVHSSSAPCKHSLERLEVDKYHVYYVLAGKGKLGHLNGKGEVLDDTVVTLNSGDIFVLAPSVPYIIETNDEKEEEEGGEGEKELTPMAMLSISVPSSLLGHQSHSRPSAAHASSERERMPEQIRLNHQETEGCLLSSRLRRTTELLTFQLPNGNKNRIAPVFDPFRDCTPFTCSIEILEPKGVIPRHKHDKAYELFIILSGE